MKKFTTIAITLMFTLGLGARVSRADDAADVQKYLALIDKIVDTAVADQNDCPKMGKDLSALIDANKDVLEMAQKKRAEGKKLPADAQKHVQESVRKMMPAIGKCHTDKDVQAALQKMKMGPPPQH